MDKPIMPTTPPLAEVRGTEFPVSPPIMGEPVNPEAVAGTVAERSSLIRRRIGVAVAAGLFIVGGLVIHEATSNDSSSTPAAAEASVKVGDTSVEICPAGMYPDGVFAATDRAFPKELHARPEAGPLNTKEKMITYLFGGKEATCGSALSNGVVTALNIDLIGAGNSGTGFGTTDIAKLTNELKGDKEKSLTTAQVNARTFESAYLNPKGIKGPYYRVTTGKDHTAEFTEESVSFKINDAWVLTAKATQPEGTTKDMNTAQVILVDKETGQIYVAHAIGNSKVNKMPEKEKQDNKDKGGETGLGQEHTGVDQGPNGEANPNGPDIGPGEGPTPEAHNGPDDTPGHTGTTGVTGTTGPHSTTPRPTTPHTTPPTVTTPPTTPHTTPPTVTTPPTTPSTTHPKGPEPTRPTTPDFPN